MKSMREYTNPDELLEKIHNYFDYCKQETLNNVENGIKMVKAPTLSGLALYLGISRMTLYKYTTQSEYSNLHEVIQIAKDMIEDWCVGMGFSGSKFAEFYLRTQYKSSYQDKQYIEHATSEMPKVTRQIEEETEELTFDVGEDIEA